MAESKLILLILAGNSALNGSFSLSRALIEQGHRVFYITSNLGNREYVESQGFNYLVVPTDDYEYPFPAAWNTKNTLIRRTRATRNIFDKLDYIYGQAEKWIAEANPDIVLLDPILTQFSIPFVKKNIPVVNINTTLSSTAQAGRPPVFSGFVPPKTSNPLAALRMKMAWQFIYAYHSIKALNRSFYLTLAFGSPGKMIRTQLKKHGAKTKKGEYGIQLIVPEIFMNSRHFDFPASQSSSPQLKLYMGACVEEKRVQESFDFKFLDKEKKLIYCAMGTMSKVYKFQKNLYQCLFEAMDQLAGYQLILQSEGVGDLGQYKRIPENVLVVARAPQLKLLELTSVFITHGGAGSTREGAYYGVPMIVFPGWHDQPGNAARVVYHGLGEKADMKTITTKKLLSLIDKVINDPDIRDNVRKMREKLRKDDNRHSIIQFIESYSSYWHA